MVDRTKKSNIKCENCKYFVKERDDDTCRTVEYCFLLDEDKHYWNRCKRFEWKGDRQ